MDESSTRATSLDRPIEQAIVALKKGAHLLKYGRRGRPKCCPFRLSTDENILIWYSGKEERQLKLSSVSKIIRGQQTVNFQRKPQPEKACQSFSLIYGNGERTLDLVCKDKDQADCWLVGLTALISRSHHIKHLASLRSVRGAHSCASSPAGYTRRKHNMGLLENSTKNSQVRSLRGSPRSVAERGFSDGLSHSSDSFHSSQSRSLSDMQMVPDDIFQHVSRLETDSHLEKAGDMSSLHSAFDYSNGGYPSVYKDDNLRDVLMWGEGTEVGILVGGVDRSTSCGSLNDALLPKLLESTCMLDVLKISCGGKHAAIVTRQGEVFCWGEEKSGRLGHKVNMDVSCPKVVESLADVQVDSVACGEYQTCALTRHGELYMWGESGQCIGPVANGKSRSWWLPRRVLGPLDGICISSIACGEWHTSVVSTAGQLYTFGDGTFGVLGHGNLHSSFQPKEVESLKGLRVKSVACGPWHTAAIVDITVDRFKGNSPGGKLFTWGDGDKGRLGHADRERKLLPTCVASLVDHDFIQVSCGRMMTVALAVKGFVCTMGSAVHCQLGNPQAENKAITVVEGKLKEEFVKEISSGSYHVAVLTSKGNVYTWGTGSNGRLGLGDVEDRSSPALVEALKDRKVCSIACGSSFTAAICLHKSISSSDQTICSGCRLPFGFTRKKHNCYNCGLVFCHACSSKSALNASLAPNKSKQHRVCDSCFTQLVKHTHCNRQKLETPSPRPPLSVRKISDLKVDLEDGISKPQVFSPKPPLHEDMKFVVGQTPSKLGGNQHSSEPVFPLSGIPLKWRSVPCPALFDSYCKETSLMSVSRPKEEVSATFPVCIQHSSPISRFATSDQSLKNSPAESDKMLIEEVQRLRLEAKDLAKQCQMRNDKIQLYKQKIEETWSRAREEAAKCKAAKEVIKALTTRLNAMSKRFLPDRGHLKKNSIEDKVDVHLPQITPVCQESYESDDLRSIFGGMHISAHVRIPRDRQTDGSFDAPIPTADLSACPHGRDGFHGCAESIDDSHLSRSDAKQNVTNRSKAEWVEQHDPGVYITFITLPCGRRGLKRVRFSRKRFSEREAETWWEENQRRVYEQYNIEGVHGSSGCKGNS